MAGNASGGADDTDGEPSQDQSEDSAASDPSATDHPAGKEQADANIEDEPAG